MKTFDHVLKKTVFIDVEASGLMEGSFPVEVAWFYGEKTYDKIINPFDHWDVNKWDYDAEAIHGLSLEYLKKNGQRPRRLALELNNFLPGKFIVSDAPEFDLKWLDILHSSVQVKREYKVESIGKLLGYIGYNFESGSQIFEKVRENHNPSGRALNGVKFLREVVKEAIRMKK